LLQETVDITSKRLWQICDHGRRIRTPRQAIIASWPNTSRTDSNAGAVLWKHRAVLAGALPIQGTRSSVLAFA
jgi:hypothetical protein